ncbi:NAD(P)-binding protein [Pseudomonas sp. G34]|uniref:NAD(P)-binding protein n=1 Tax=Pseudomonas sp. G34 TaxID=3059083 RepID=UPI002806A981|nr:NAD(P)-binding protein [Pseudomonas sp. G34]MDQ7985435.1 NAD(P)-binding protein [Pseudomonas sp. G34]
MRVLIVGGGIAGLAVARALQLQGFGADLIEHRADVPQAGTGLYLPGNAARALQAPGLLGSIAALAMPIAT